MKQEDTLRLFLTLLIFMLLPELLFPGTAPLGKPRFPALRCAFIFLFFTFCLWNERLYGLRLPVIAERYKNEIGCIGMLFGCFSHFLAVYVYPHFE